MQIAPTQNAREYIHALLILPCGIEWARANLSRMCQIYELPSPAQVFSARARDRVASLCASAVTSVFSLSRCFSPSLVLSPEGATMALATTSAPAFVRLSSRGWSRAAILSLSFSLSELFLNFTLQLPAPRRCLSFSFLPARLFPLFS